MATGSRPRVLVIDDEAQVRAFVGDALDSLGYGVDEAEDGVQGSRCSIATGTTCW